MKLCISQKEGERRSDVKGGKKTSKNSSAVGGKKKSSSCTTTTTTRFTLLLVIEIKFVSMTLWRASKVREARPSRDTSRQRRP